MRLRVEKVELPPWQIIRLPTEKARWPNIKFLLMTTLLFVVPIAQAEMEHGVCEAEDGCDPGPEPVPISGLAEATESRPTAGLAQAIETGPISGPASGPISGLAQAAESGPISRPAEALESGPIAAPAQAPESGPLSGPLQAVKSGPLQAAESGPISGPAHAAESKPISGPVEAFGSKLISGPVQRAGPLQAVEYGSISEPAQAPKSGPVSEPAEAVESGPISGPLQAVDSGPISGPAHAAESKPISRPVEAFESKLISGPVQAPESGPISAPAEVVESEPISGPLQAVESGPKSAPVQTPESRPAEATSATVPAMGVAESQKSSSPHGTGEGAVGKVVVVVPLPATSHVMLFANVGRELTRLGHTVWLVVPVRLAAKGQIDLTNVSTILIEEGGDFEEQGPAAVVDQFLRGGSSSWAVLHMAALTVHLSDSMLRNESFLRHLGSLTPALFVLENAPIMPMLTLLPYKLGVPYAMLGTAFDAMSSHVPFSPAAQPFPLLAFTDSMTFWQRVVNFLVIYLCLLNPYDPFMPRNAAAIYAPERPFLTNEQLKHGAEIRLLETDPITDYPKPSVPNVKFIGGTMLRSARVLEPPFQSFVDEAKEGLLIVTFGSYVVDLPKDIRDNLFDAFSRLPLRVVFRCNISSPDPSRIMTSSWLPQSDLLAHPNTKLFLSHCGKNGIYESLYHAIPMVCAPLFADQPYNARCVHSKGFGEIVDLRTVSADELVATVMQVLSTPSYKQAISRASLLFRHLYSHPSREAAQWLSHVMQYGGRYMRYAGQDIPMYQLLGIDVWGFLLLVLLLTVSCVRLVWKLIKRICMQMFMPA